jgi:hypothetical protein
LASTVQDLHSVSDGVPLPVVLPPSAPVPVPPSPVPVVTTQRPVAALQDLPGAQLGLRRQPCTQALLTLSQM